MSINIAAAGLIAAFILQLALLKFTQNRALRLIPVYILAAGAVTAVLCRFGIIIENDGGFINGGAITAAVLMIFLVFWIAGAALACLLWMLLNRKKD